MNGMVVGFTNWVNRRGRYARKDLGCRLRFLDVFFENSDRFFKLIVQFLESVTFSETKENEMRINAEDIRNHSYPDAARSRKSRQHHRNYGVPRIFACQGVQ